MTISVLALILSGVTLWLSHLRRGVIKMTKPTVIFFGPDSGETGSPKLFLRTLLYSTGSKGVVLEHMFARLERNETRQNFNIWVYGDKELSRGSGLFVGPEGLAANHHFLAQTDLDSFEFKAGDYRLSLFAKAVGQDHGHELASVSLNITPEEAKQLQVPNTGIYFDWGPDSSRYHSKIDARNELDLDPMRFLEAISNPPADTGASNEGN